MRGSILMRCGTVPWLPFYTMPIVLHLRVGAEKIPKCTGQSAMKQKQNHIRCFPAAAAEDQLNDNWLIHWLVHQANSPLAKSEIKQRRQASLLLLHKLGYSISHVFCQFCQCHLMQAQQPSATWLNTHCCFLGNDTVILTYLKITHVDQILDHLDMVSKIYSGFTFLLFQWWMLIINMFKVWNFQFSWNLWLHIAGFFSSLTAFISGL